MPTSQSRDRLAQRCGKATARVRNRFGSQIVIGGRTLSVQVRSLERREREEIPDGARNAASADLRVFEGNPADFPAPPFPGSTLTWHGASYTVLLSVPGDDELAGVSLTLHITAYLSPPSGQGANEAAQLTKFPAPPQ